MYTRDTLSASCYNHPTFDKMKDSVWLTAGEKMLDRSPAFRRHHWSRTTDNLDGCKAAKLFSVVNG